MPRTKADERINDPAMKKTFTTLLFLTLLIGISYAQPVPGYVPTNGLVGWWPFNGNAQDQSGNGNHGSVSGATLSADRHGVPNRAYTFNGTSSLITVAPPNASFSGGVTISLWCKLLPGSGNAQFMVARGNDNNLGHFHVQYNQQAFPRKFAGAVNQWFNTPGVYSADTYPTPHDNWYHVVYTYDNTVQILYINCREVARTYINQPIAPNPSPILFGNGFGNHNDSYRVRGSLDDIGIWARALTHQEVKGLYFSTIMDPNPPNTSVAQSACDSYTWPQTGRTYTQSGSYTDTLNTSCGCDSLVTLNLTIHPSRQDTIRAAICQGNAYAFQGNTYQDGGAYTARYTGAHGCDSTITLLLTVNPVFRDTVRASICAGASYILPNGNQVSASGTYTFNLPTATYGCDSTTTTILTALPDSNYFRFVTDSITPGQNYTLPDGRSVDTAGVYVSNLRTSNGCDSIITTSLFFRSIQYKLYIPNAFSPNDDGINDTWQVYGDKAAVQRLEVQVYDRWGEKLFQSTDADFHWNGRFRGKPAPMETYVYVIRVWWINRTSPETLTDSITLMR